MVLRISIWSTGPMKRMTFARNSAAVGSGIGHIEIDLDVDQQAADVGRLSFHRHAELRAHRAAAAITSEEIRAFDCARAIRGVEARDHAAVELSKRRQTMLQMERSGAASIERRAQDRL